MSDNLIFKIFNQKLIAINVKEIVFIKLALMYTLQEYLIFGPLPCHLVIWNCSQDTAFEMAEKDLVVQEIQVKVSKIEDKLQMVTRK